MLNNTTAFPSATPRRVPGLLATSVCSASGWLAFVAGTHPSPLDVRWAEALLLLAALALVPLGLHAARATDVRCAPFRSLYASPASAWIALAAAVLLAVAFRLPAGWTAGVLSLPWLLTTTVIAAAGVRRLWSGAYRSPAESAIAAGLLYLCVGGGWTLLSRLGARPLEFEPVIVLLTGIHFHYAGFVLPIVAGLSARLVGGRTAAATCLVVVAAVPLVAAGITATQLGGGPLLECGASWLMALGGIATAILLVRCAARDEVAMLPRWLWRAAAVSLAFGMVLAALYGARAYLDVGSLDIPWMRALHGTANAVGFSVAALVGWSLWLNRATPAASPAPPLPDGRALRSATARSCR